MADATSFHAHRSSLFNEVDEVSEEEGEDQLLMSQEGIRCVVDITTSHLKDIKYRVISLIKSKTPSFSLKLCLQFDSLHFDEIFFVVSNFCFNLKSVQN